MNCGIYLIRSTVSPPRHQTHRKFHLRFHRGIEPQAVGHAVGRAKSHGAAGKDIAMLPRRLVRCIRPGGIGPRQAAQQRLAFLQTSVVVAMENRFSTKTSSAAVAAPAPGHRAGHGETKGLAHRESYPAAGTATAGGSGFTGGRQITTTAVGVMLTHREEGDAG